MTKKLLASLLAALMLCVLFAGCSTIREVWISEDDPTATDTAGGEPDDGNDSTEPNDSVVKTDSQGKTYYVKKTTDRNQKTKAPSTASNKPPRTKPVNKNQALPFTPVADAGANYNVSGTISIAVDTVRPTDYEAMFDLMAKLFPKVNIKLDYWSHDQHDDAREYLTSRFSTGTAADIIWDEAGSIPNYLVNNWIYPITKQVKADPEASNIPKNLVENYTFGGELYAVPHQATFELVAINYNLLTQLNAKMPSTKWTWQEYEDLLVKGASGFTSGKCVGNTDLFESHHRYAWWLNSQKKDKYSRYSYNYRTGQFEADAFIKGVAKFRELRVKTIGIEGWYESTQKSSDGTSNLSHYLGLSSYKTAWTAGKALVEDTLTAYTDKWNNLKFEYRLLPTPNTNGNLMMHVDHCFITTNCADEKIPAAFQLLRFMSYSTNGNLARLEMYEKKNEGKYNLNSHIYYPTTTNTKIINKFKNLDRIKSSKTGYEVYLLENIKNSSRYDTFKIVYYFNNTYTDSGVGKVLNNVTDGLKEPSALNEPIAKLNRMRQEADSEFRTKLAQAQAQFKKTHPNY